MSIQVTYRKTRRLSMRIVKNGDVHVSVPFGISRSQIVAFIEEHHQWIDEARKRVFIQQQQRVDFFAQLPLTTRAECEEALCRLKAIVEPLIAKYSQVMGVVPTSVTYKRMISRWGLCNVRKSSLCFSLYLLLLPDWCIEHVVVHELCHLFEPSHNARFYDLMDRFFPRWRDARKETRQRKR